MRPQIAFSFLFLIMLLLAMLVPQAFVQAQAGCFDASGNPIPCPTEEPGDRRSTRTPLPPTHTFTPTSTATSTHTMTATATITPTATVPSPTSTVTLTPTATPFFSNASTSWLPGVGIGAFLLFVVVMIFIPAMQKVRVARRGY